MLILIAIDNGLTCDFVVNQGFDYDRSLILPEIFSLKTDCTNTVLYLVYSIY